MTASVVHSLLTLCVVMSMMDVLSSSPRPRPIVNGKPARNNQFPFAVAFSLHPGASGYFCGGTLISLGAGYAWAISAAHCFLDIANRTVYASPGGDDLASTDAKWHRVLSVLSADMNVYSFNNDLALAKIETGHQQVIIRRANRMPPDKAECLIYGYGTRSYDNNAVTSNFIRYGRVNTISFVECVKILGRVMAPSEGMGQFCARSGNGVDACNGITSFGMGCGGSTAGVYVSVFHHKNWIDSRLRQKT